MINGLRLQYFAFQSYDPLIVSLFYIRSFHSWTTHNLVINQFGYLYEILYECVYGKDDISRAILIVSYSPLNVNLFIKRSCTPSYSVAVWDILMKLESSKGHVLHTVTAAFRF